MYTQRKGCQRGERRIGVTRKESHQDFFSSLHHSIVFPRKYRLDGRFVTLALPHDGYNGWVINTSQRRGVWYGIRGKRQYCNKYNRNTSDREIYLDNEVFEYEQHVTKMESPQLTTAKKIIKGNRLDENILIVEDNSELRDYLVDYLSDYYNVFEAS